ncbi:MAG: hypothetical protein E5299_01758 [Burkholderia gladioli]|nr:MAG: hypothetical protein E5299_01758 [Burkholderia gladioli]
MITTNTILQIDITEELTCPHIAATHPSTPNLHKANESRPKSSRQAFFNSLLKSRSMQSAQKHIHILAASFHHLMRGFWCVVCAPCRRA